MNSWDDLSATIKDLLEQKKYEQVVTLSQNFELQVSLSFCIRSTKLTPSLISAAG